MPPLSLIQVGWDAQKSDLRQPGRAFSLACGRGDQGRPLLNLPTGTAIRDVGQELRYLGRFVIDPHGDDSTHWLVEARDAQFGRRNVGVINVYLKPCSAGRPQSLVQCGSEQL